VTVPPNYIAAPNAVSFTVTRSEASANPLGVSLHPFAGAALIGADYTADGVVATIPANESSVTFSLIPVDDDVFEGEEKIHAILKATSEYWLSATFRAEATIADNDIDLAIDSNNDGRISKADEEVENTSSNAGKLIVVNRDDDDQDRILDFADGFNAFDGTDADQDVAGEEFTPVILRLPAGLPSNATVTFDYDLASLSDVTQTITEVEALDGETYEKYEYTVGEGLLRLWKQPGNLARTESDLLAPDVAHSLSSLGASGGNVTLYIEAVNGSPAGVSLSATLTRSGGTSDDEVKILPLDPVVGIDPGEEIEGFNIVRGGGSLSLEGTESNDILIASPTNAIINGLGGDDIIFTSSGDYEINPGRGRDLVFAFQGSSVIRGDGRDEVSYIEGNPTGAVQLSNKTSEQPSFPPSAPLAVDVKSQAFTSEDIVLAYKWAFGEDDVWLGAFEAGGGKVLAVEGDGNPFTKWNVDWLQNEWFGP